MRLLMVAIIISAAGPSMATEDGMKVFDQTGRYSGSYVCFAEAATGFQYDKVSKRWAAEIYDADGTSFQLRMSPVGVKDMALGDWSEVAIKYAIEIIDGSNKNGTCASMIDAMSGDYKTIVVGTKGEFRCTARFFDYAMNMSAGKYVRSLTSGFADNQDDESLTPYIEVGRCRKLK